MSTVTLESNSITEFYEDGVLTRVRARYILDHPVQGLQHGTAELLDEQLTAWASANDATKTSLLRGAIQTASQRIDAQLDIRPVHTGVVLSDDLFGDPIEL